MATPNTPVSNAPAKGTKLPDGLSVQISQTWKTFRWDHATTVGGGDPTLNGLLSFAKKEVAPADKLASPQTANLGDLTEEQAKVLSQNYYNLPAILQKGGFKVLDDKANAFIDRATKAKANLRQRFGNSPIPAPEMKRMDELVNQLAFKCVEILVKGYNVTRHNPKGSRQRSSDGMYVTERILRRVYVDRPLSDAEVKNLLDTVTGSLIASCVREAEYRIIDKGCDPAGYRHHEIIMAPVKSSTGSIPARRPNPRE